jgi:formiminotetrahydrofolate cyclodeaminase
MAQEENRCFPAGSSQISGIESHAAARWIICSLLYGKREEFHLKLEHLSVRDFTEELGSANPTPGGGSAAALCGALGAALSAMVSRLTLGNEKYREDWQSMGAVQQTADLMTEQFLELVQRDADAYRTVIAAMKLPKKTEEDKAARHKAFQEATKNAAKVPLETLRTSEKLIALTKEAMERGNPNTLTDAGAALQLARTAAVVAAYNVRINLPGLQDEEFVTACKEEVEEALERVESLFLEVAGYVEANLP